MSVPFLMGCPVIQHSAEWRAGSSLPPNHPQPPWPSCHQLDRRVTAALTCISAGLRGLSLWSDRRRIGQASGRRPHWLAWHGSREMLTPAKSRQNCTLIALQSAEGVRAQWDVIGRIKKKRRRKAKITVAALLSCRSRWRTTVSFIIA